jgi:hypothetical protein
MSQDAATSEDLVIGAYSLSSPRVSKKIAMHFLAKQLINLAKH